MSKKKSYMNRKNLLNEEVHSVCEGILSYAMDKIHKFFFVNPALKKSKKVSKSISRLNKSVAEFEAAVNDEMKSIGSKKRVKIKPYTAKDLMSGRK